MADKILVIDDSSDIHALVKAKLGKENVDIRCAYDGASGLATAREFQPNLILLDIDMPDRDGFAVCADLKANSTTKDVPIIFLTVATSTQDKVRGLDLGAIDYVTKPFEPAELRARVRAALRTRDLLDLLSKKAMIDGLTGLWNRNYLDARLTIETSAARRSQQPLSCIMVDADRFKSINDTYGHNFGDDVLRGIAATLTEHCRTEDIVCRYGGEEFTILLPKVDLPEAAELADRLRLAIEARCFLYRGEVVRVTCSFGVADLRVPIPPSVLEHADQALYVAKQSGRNRVETCQSGTLLVPAHA